MATAATTTQPRTHAAGRVGDAKHDVVEREEASKQQRVSRLAVEGGGSGDRGIISSDDGAVHGQRRSWGRATTTLPPPHAWLAVDDAATAARNISRRRRDDVDNNGRSSSAPAAETVEEDQWARLLRGGGGGGRHYNSRRSSFSVARRQDRAEREAWLDRAWEMKRSWHQRNGGAPDADTPVVVVVGGGNSSPPLSSDDEHHHNHHHHHGGVAMDVEEVRACRDLGLELPPDCTVEIQCYGLSGDTSPTHHAAGGSGADDSASPCGGGGVSSPTGADPTDVKARLKVWAQAVALASTTQLGS